MEEHQEEDETVKAYQVGAFHAALVEYQVVAYHGVESLEVPETCLEVAFEIEMVVLQQGNLAADANMQ